MNLRWLTKLPEKLFQWLGGHRPQAVAAETPVPQIAPRRRLPKTGGAFGHPRWMRAERMKPL